MFETSHEMDRLHIQNLIICVVTFEFATLSLNVKGSLRLPAFSVYNLRFKMDLRQTQVKPTCL